MSARPPKPRAELDVHAGRILVVDDDPTACLFLKAVLEQKGYRVAQAQSVTAARDRIEQHGVATYDCVVTDYQMPEQNGIELLRWLADQDESLATIVVTAESEKDTVAQSLRSGACDFLDKPVEPRALHASAERAVTLTRQRRKLVASQAAVEEVGRFQNTMLRSDNPADRLPIELCFHPQQEAGGDFLNRSLLGPDRHFILLTDVSGHDLKAAFLSAYFQGLVRGMLEHKATIPEIFAYFNQLLTQEWNTASSSAALTDGLSASVAACALLVDAQAATVSVLTSGAPLPLHLDRHGNIKTLGEGGSAPLGWFPDSEFKGVTCSIAESGCLLIWSDGLESLAETHQISPCALATALVLAHRRLRSMPELSAATDDILAAHISLTTKGDPQAGFLPVLFEDYHGGQCREINALENCWRRHLQFCLPELRDDQMYNILLATREAVINALQHGCRSSASQTARFALSYHAQRRMVRLHMSDPGPGHDFDLAAHELSAASDLIAAHRGLILMRHLSTHCCSQRRGAEITLDFALDTDQTTTGD